jgi:hypothetical protein
MVQCGFVDDERVGCPSTAFIARGGDEQPIRLNVTDEAVQRAFSKRTRLLANR